MQIFYEKKAKMIIESLKAMRVAYIPFGVTRPLLNEFCRTHSTKHASERAYTTSLTGGFL